MAKTKPVKITRRTKVKLPGYSNRSAADRTGLSPRTIQFYTEKTIVVPEIDDPLGRGTVRRYSEFNLVELLLVRKIGRRASMNTVEKVMRSLRKLSLWKKWTALFPERSNRPEEAAIVIHFDEEDNPTVDLVEGPDLMVNSYDDDGGTVIVEVTREFEKIYG